MTKRWDVITAGEIYVDHIFTGFATWPDPGAEVFAPSYARELGGGAAITACGLGRLGRKVATLGAIGTEESTWIASVLNAHQVDAGALRQVAGHSGTTVSISTRGDRSFFSYAGPNRPLPEWWQDDEVREFLVQASHVHFALALPRWLAQRLLPALRAAETVVSLDPGWQPEWSKDAANLATCREVDFFLPNEKEAAEICGFEPHRETPEELAAALLGRGFRNTIIKLGSKGAITNVGGVVRSVAGPSVEVVDTTGAGDAFDAGVIDAILERTTVEAMLWRGCQVGAFSVGSEGALRGLPQRNQLTERE